MDTSVTPVIVVLEADFRQPAGRLLLEPSEWGVATAVSWNLCDNDRDVCWYEQDQEFDALVVKVVNRCVRCRCASHHYGRMRMPIMGTAHDVDDSYENHD